MSRWKAAAIHLSISAAIGLVAAILIFGVWYPPPYSQATGATELVVLLLGVDLTLGPLLTLVVFKTGKKSLRFDLSVIATLQACAFLYGMSVVVRARPAFIVGAVDRFVVVAANELDPEDLAKGRRPEFRSVPWTGPRLVGAELPTDPAKRDRLLFSGLSGKDVEKYPEYYVTYREAAPALLERARPVDQLHFSDPAEQEILDRAIAEATEARGRLLYLPVMARRGSMTMLLDASSGEPLKAVALDPWPDDEIKQARHGSDTPPKHD